MDVWEKLVGLLENHCAVIGEDHCKASQSGECTPRDCAICLASDLISNGVTVQEWVSVAERLPEIGQKCLIANREIVVRGWLLPDGVWKTGVSSDEIWSKFSLYPPTHWMPLPEPPL